MSWKSAIAWVTLFALLALIGSRAVGGGGEADPDGREGSRTHSRHSNTATKSLTGKVPRIVDGDTIKVDLDGGELETVRYIGVDTPETVKPGEPVQCFGKAASAYNRRLVEGKQVRLRVGREPRDRYGRLLAYVYVRPQNAFVNSLLVAGGYARPLTIPPNDTFAARFARLAAEAKRRGIGLWGACT